MLRSRYLAIPVVLIAVAIAAWFWMSRKSAADVAIAWGLPGTWQRDCAAPVSSENPRYDYIIEDGKLLLRRDFGGPAQDSSVISDAEITQAGDIEYIVKFVQLGTNRQAQVTRQNMLGKAPDGRIRAVFNKDMGTGAESVVDSVRTANSEPTPWMSLCMPK